MEKNIFEKIRDKESDADIVFKNEYVTAFKDIYPCAPIHILIIPNKMIRSLNDVEKDDAIYLATILISAKEIAEKFYIDKSGYRLITNCGNDGGQDVQYLHFHLVGGVPLGRMIGLPKNSQKIFKEFVNKTKTSSPILKSEV